MIGLKFGRIRITTHGDTKRFKSGSTHYTYNGVCDCGKTVYNVSGQSLRNGSSRSCGCLKTESLQNRAYIYLIDQDKEQLSQSAMARKHGISIMTLKYHLNKFGNYKDKIYYVNP